jgi:hypothetical protein
VAWRDDNNNKKLDNNPNVDAQVRTFCGEKKMVLFRESKNILQREFQLTLLVPGSVFCYHELLSFLLFA